LEPKTVLIRATVKNQHGDVLTVNLIDCFAGAECVVHKDAIVVGEK
jgi:hypothetical protein